MAITPRKDLLLNVLWPWFEVNGDPVSWLKGQCRCNFSEGRVTLVASPWKNFPWPVGWGSIF